MGQITITLEARETFTVGAQRHRARPVRGLNPTIVECIDDVVMAAIVNAENLELDAATLGEPLSDWGALDAYVLQSNSARRLIVARENVPWTTKLALRRIRASFDPAGILNPGGVFV